MKTIPIHAISLGCPKNLVDTEVLLGGLPGKAEPVDDPALARVVLVNTCGFIRPAVEESVAAILEAARCLEGLSPKPLLVVAGCLVNRYGPELKAEMPEVDLWLTTRELEAWPGRIAAALEVHEPKRPGSTAAHKAGGPERPGRLISTPPSYAYLKIGEGCRHACRFCAIPAIRGPLASRPDADILAEARRILTSGRKEIVLVAQDLTAHGRDRGARHGLRDLLERLLPLSGLERLRLMYLYPAGLTKDFLGYLRQAGRPFIPYFDIPVQHSHPDILASMGRPFARDPRRTLDLVRQFFPEAVVRSSLIVGYPGEAPGRFRHLKRFVAEARFNHLGVFAYQAEEGTPAAALPGQTTPRQRQARRRSLMALQAGLSAEWLAGFVGREVDVLVDAPHPEWPGLHVGRTWFQAPEVDGVTYVSGPGVAPGALVRAVVDEAQTYDLVALAE